MKIIIETNKNSGCASCSFYDDDEDNIKLWDDMPDKSKCLAVSMLSASTLLFYEFLPKNDEN